MGAVSGWSRLMCVHTPSDETWTRVKALGDLMTLSWMRNGEVIHSSNGCGCVVDVCCSVVSCWCYAMMLVLPVLSASSEQHSTHVCRAPNVSHDTPLGVLC